MGYAQTQRMLMLETLRKRARLRRSGREYASPCEARGCSDSRFLETWGGGGGGAWGLSTYLEALCKYTLAMSIKSVPMSSACDINTMCSVSPSS